MKTRPLVAGATAAALLLAGCSGGGGAQSSNASDSGRVTITLATFNDFGYSDEMLQEYMDENPNVTIVHNRAALATDARANYFQKLGKTGLADIEAVEGSWLPEIMKYADLLAPVPEDFKGRWLDWKEDQATDPDGNLIGYGTDIGPVAVCYRSDLFEEAGLPSDRDAVAELLAGDWANYLDVGERYVDATGKAFYSISGNISGTMINQLPAPFEDPETNEITATTNPEVKAVYDQLVAAIPTQSAHLLEWTDDWYAGLANGDFASSLCPAWFVGVIEGNAPEVTTWNVANVLPNGGGNTGGSFLTVPANGKNVEEAQELAAWLTAKEQQVKAFDNVGAFPSNQESLKDSALLDYTSEYFQDAPLGEIFSDRAEAVTHIPYMGPNFQTIMELFGDALVRVEQGTSDADASWSQFVSEVDALK